MVAAEINRAASDPSSALSVGWARRLFAIAGALALAILLIGGTELYSALGGSGKLMTQMMINAIIVIGMQVYIGNTGVLSFGHIGFGGIAGYTFAILAISVERKATVLPNAPFGLSEVALPPLTAGAIALLVTVTIGIIIGIGLARSGAKSGAVAATVITLALLFMVHELAVNWDRLTGGDRAGLSFPIGGALQSRLPIIAVLIASIIAARLFGVSRLARQARAAREDDLAARAMGINPAVGQMAALLLSVAIVAAGACLRTFELGSITPRFFFFDFTLLTLAMLIVGGRNSLTGALLGVVVITAGNEFTRYLAGPSVDFAGVVFRPGLSDIFLGGAMLGFMILRPAGILGDFELDEPLLQRWRHRRDDARSPVAENTAPADTAAATDAAASTNTGVSAERTTSAASVATVSSTPMRLEAELITARFGGFVALSEASIAARSDHIVGIIGPNGAGKTTLLNVITGLVPHATGHVRLGPVESAAGTATMAPQELLGLPAHCIARAGIVRTFQNLRLFGSLTVRENVEVTALGRHSRGADPDTLLRLAGLWSQRDRRAEELDYGTARRVELARAAAASPHFLLLDEPTSGMSDAESVAMIDLVRSVAAAAGSGVIVIDHDLAFITGICDEIYCLDQGRVLAHGRPEEIQANPAVQAAYLGVAA